MCATFEIVGLPSNICSISEVSILRYEDSFAELGVTKDIQEIRWKHYEKKRREKLALVREARQVHCLSSLIERREGLF